MMKWKPWFVWYPVQTCVGIRWLCTLERTWITNPGYNMSVWAEPGWWHYRDPVKSYSLKLKGKK